MKKISEKIYKRLKYISFAIIAIVVVLFFAAGLENPEAIGTVLMAPVALAWIADGKFKELTDEEVSKLNIDDLSSYYSAYNKHKAEQIDEKIKAKASLDEVNELKKKFYEFQHKQLEILAKQGLALAKIKTNETVKPRGLKGLFEDLKDNIQKFVSKESGILKFNVKADTLRSSVTNNPQGMLLNRIARIAEPIFTFTDYFTPIPVSANSNGVVRYIDWDLATSVRAAAMRAEGATFPESTAKWIGYSLPLEKVGDTIPVSEEMLQDVIWAEAELRDFLNNNVKRVENQQLYNGNGTPPNISGVYTLAPTFDTVAYAASSKAKTTTPDLVDLVDILKKEIQNGKSGKYNVNAVFVSWEEYTAALLEKDTTGRRIREELKSIGVDYVPSSFVTANQLVLGDTRFAKVYQIEDYNVEIDRNGTDFVDDMLTMRAKKRMALLIRQADRDGFLKVTDIAAALIAITV